MSEKPELTNRMQANCIGEFSWKEEAPYYDENGELHEYEAERIVPWTLCKDIYKRMYRYSPLPTHIEKLEQENKRLAERDLVAALFLNGENGEELVVGSDLQTDEDSGFSNFVVFNQESGYKQKITFKIEEI